MRFPTQSLLLLALGTIAASRTPCYGDGTICGANKAHIGCCNGLTCVLEGSASKCRHRCEDGGGFCPADQPMCHEEFGVRKCWSCLPNGYTCAENNDCCSTYCSVGGSKCF
ncbi:unnamed protein product [Zymoseptoria tritici ST99CH_3D1]|nr:unnamed protein product [Zymoseptoria tritici ST99CH_3D1]